MQPSALQTITVAVGSQTPTVEFAATLNGKPIDAGWSVDNGAAATVSASTGKTITFSPTGKLGGVVKVLAGLNGKTVERQVLIKLTGSQNGADPTNPKQQPQIAGDAGTLKDGGGVGGVGGEGLGQGVADPATQAALASPTSDGADKALKLIYPYDATVWPRGLLAPLLMWDWAEHDADAIQIELSTTTGSFSYKGTFGRPAVLTQTGGAFIRHPIPQDIWDMATSSAGGADKLTVKLTVAKGGQAYGPIAQTWTIAPARPSGVIYYNSYGTNLAKNFNGAVAGGMFGGAVLSIHAGDTGPKLVAGTNTLNTGCRVCHSVSGDGSRLIVESHDSGTSNAYDLSPTTISAEHRLDNHAQFPAISRDGSKALTSAGTVLGLSSASPYDTALAVNAVPGYTDLGTPSFSADTKRVAFNPMAGTAAGLLPAKQIVVMDFDDATNTFSNPVVVSESAVGDAGVRPGWPAFFPDGGSVVYQQQVSISAVSDETATTPIGDLRTRRDARARIHWTSASDAAHVTPLDRLNGIDGGTSYLPTLMNPPALACTADNKVVGNIDPSHASDADYNYEPTVNPVASGGYVWVVFTSRRMYGSVATIPPFCSDPRGVDLIDNVTTKKLWVAAVDVGAAPGADASHPAFYLPAQELLAGNARGFWAQDPCKGDGQSCESGDQCCGGFCRPDGEGALVCLDTPPNNTCSAPQEKCETASDCCDSTNACLNGYCAQKGPA